MQSRRLRNSADVAAVVCALLVISSKKQVADLCPFACIPAAACDEVLTPADRVSVVARHPSRWIARRRWRRLSYL
jgi:hypothetical protein